MENTFLPPNYEKPASTSKYLKLLDGDNKIRILSPAIVGWIDWQDTADGRKPVRTKDKPETSFNPEKPVKHFWTFVVWDYKDEAVKILEIVQSTIQDAIYSLHNDKDWGNPIKYDLTIKRTGEELKTKYNVVPTPPKELSETIKSAYLSVKIDLNKLYTNEDPFAEVDANSHQGGREEIDTSNTPF